MKEISTIIIEKVILQLIKIKFIVFAGLKCKESLEKT